MGRDRYHKFDPPIGRPTRPRITEPMAKPDEWESDDSDSAAEDSDLDEEFPLGDGVADLASVVSCPYCGESVEITLDPGSGAHQQYIEDCAVCCRPWNVFVTYLDDGSAEVNVEASDDA